MIRECNGLFEADVEVHRGAAFREFAVGRAWPDRTAGLAVMAIQPFDAVEPINRDWEINTRLAAMAFWLQLRTLHDPEAVASLARDVLSTYRDTAIAAGEPYYSRRYDNLLDATEDGHSVGSTGGEAAAECATWPPSGCRGTRAVQAAERSDRPPTPSG